MNYFNNIDYKVNKSAIQGVSVSEQPVFNSVVEISNGDNVKYEVHPSGKYLTAVRTLNPIFRYPFSYGFIPQTLEEDGDGLDVIIITPEPLEHLTVVEVRVLGFIDTTDKGVSDCKIIAVPAYSSLKRVSIDKVMSFLKNYKYPNTSDTLVGDYVQDSTQAIQKIESAHKRWESSLDTPLQDVKVPKVETHVVESKVKGEIELSKKELEIKEPVEEQPAEEPVKEEPVQESLQVKVPKEEVKAEQSAPFLQKSVESNSSPIRVGVDEDWLA